MSRSAVIIDKWKLPIFSKHLRKAGFSYDTDAGLTPSTMTLYVDYVSLEPLKTVIETAQEECIRSKSK